jgi:hypothetical protein
MISKLLEEDVIDRFPMGKVGGQIAPGTATLNEIQDSIDDSPPIFGRSSAFGWLGEHGGGGKPIGHRSSWCRSWRFSSPENRCRESKNRKTTSQIKRFLHFLKNHLF